nr:helix-turn-helix domain-containing protein [Thalassobaculum salexigens]
MSILRESFAEVAARHGLEVEHLVGRISLRVPEVARTLGVSTRKVEQWVASGELAAWRRGRVVGVALVDLLRFLEESRIQPRGRSVAERAAALLER